MNFDSDVKLDSNELRNALDCLGRHAHEQNLYGWSFPKSDYVRSKKIENQDFLKKLNENHWEWVWMCLD